MSSSQNTEYENFVFNKTAPTLLMIVGGLSVGVLIACFFAVFERHFIGKFLRALLARGAKSPETALTLEELGLSRNGLLKREISRAGVTRKLIAIVDADGTVRDYESELRAAFPEYAALIADERRETESEPHPDAPVDTGSILAEADTVGGEDTAPVREVKRMGRPRGGSFRPRPVNFETARFFIPEPLVYRAEIRSASKGNSPWMLVIAAVIVLAVFLLALRFIPAFLNMLDATISNLRF